MNLKQAVNFGTQKLSHLENPKLEAEVLLAQLLKKDRTWLRAHEKTPLSLRQSLKYRWWIGRRAKHTPNAYIVGEVLWHDLALKVNRHTLIPRDETEILCHHIKDNTPKTPQSILDIGTGSGCIAIALAKNWPKAEVEGIDISRRALQYARYNAQVNHTSINFKRSDLLNIIADKTHLDLVVANLPYVPEYMIVTQEVSKEPRTAIFSGSDGLQHLRALEAQIKDKHLTFNQLWLEFLPSQADAIKKLFSAYHVTFFPSIDGQIFFAIIERHASHTLLQK